MVRVGGLGGASTISAEEKIHDLLCGLSPKLRNSCDDNAFLRLIAQLEISRGLYEEIPDHLVVYLHVGDEDVVSKLRVILNRVENVANGEHTASQ